MVFWIDDANPDATPSQHEDRFSRYGDSHIKDKTITVLSLTRGSLIHGVRAFWILEVQFGSCGYIGILLYQNRFCWYKQTKMASAEAVPSDVSAHFDVNEAKKR